jgi:radical SAM protein with 4Fe4S-binding SPASM domain
MKKLEKIAVNVSRGNTNRLKDINRVLRKRNIPLLDVHFDTKNPPAFFRLKPILYNLINRYEEKTSIIYFNIPYCVLPDAEEHIINLESESKTKYSACKKCKFDNFCGGFPEKHERKGIQAVPDTLKQVCIELTNKCNLDCSFCFSKKSDTDFFESEKVFSIIDQAKEMGIQRIRFTGGEPMLDPNLPKYMKYAKSSGMVVWLNSNATLTEKFNKDIVKQMDSLLVPIHHYTGPGESKITGKANSLKKKVKTIQKIKKMRPDFFLRSGTTINQSNVGSLFEIFKFTKIRLNLVTEVYRLITNKEESMIEPLIYQFFEQNLRFYNKHGKRCIMPNGFPFCFFENPDDARLFSLGGFLDDGRDRLVLNSKGNAKPMYYSKGRVGNWKNLRKAWESETMRKLRNLQYLPRECMTCKYHPICKGGSRTLAKMNRGSYFANDPLKS